MGAAFPSGAGFEWTTFQGIADFLGATFPNGAGFLGVTFQSIARFAEATFRGAQFDEATFKDTAVFAGATFKRVARFHEATFQRLAWFDRVTFQGDAEFYRATFQQARQLGPMLVRKSLRLDQAVFHERAQIEVAAAAVCCQRTRFPAGVQLRVRRAQVVLDDADLAAPSILVSAPEFQGLEEGRWARGLERLQPTGVRASRPRLVSVRRADVAGLTVAGVELRACRFAGAHHLDQLRIEESDFASTPTGWRWTTRQTIAEEHHWRATDPHAPVDNGHAAANKPSPATNKPSPATNSREARRRREWYRLTQQAPAWLADDPPTPAQIAALYRALRKGREDSKDEPGAADFYYGEMEMRRHAKRAQIRREHQRGTAAAAAAEYVILWLYWLVSGYGLRAWRALAALAVVIGLVGVGFSRVGFHHVWHRDDQEPAGVGEIVGRAEFRERVSSHMRLGVYWRVRTISSTWQCSQRSCQIRWQGPAAAPLVRGPDQ